MKTPLLCLFVLLTTLFSASGNTPAINEVLVRLQKVLDSGEGFSELTDDLEQLENKELVALLKTIDQAWPNLRDRYVKDLQQFIKSATTGSERSDDKKRIRKARSEFMEVYQKDEISMKPLLKTVSMPAVEELRTIILPTFDAIFATASVKLTEQREKTHLLAKFRDAIVDTAILPNEEKAVEFLTKAEKEEITKLQDLPRKGLKIIEENDKIAKKANLPELERQGIRELNEWRLLLGLTALTIDPKLCDAGRDHSKDMKEHGFFAHESPIEGKRTPSDRARLAGTQGGGENIYMGSGSPSSANRGWFFSPGHHKNMFSARYRMIGLGNFGAHWTQMFH